ncbi:MAG: hypothetical protein KJO38_01975, partial [Gammaproteobacteria bacterium]|nr:hypothetical protein [Gammaproteobacteria bacterium]
MFSNNKQRSIAEPLAPLSRASQPAPIADMPARKWVPAVMFGADLLAVLVAVSLATLARAALSSWAPIDLFP